jgi:O-6-methylguanine DNA methyltransferase
MSTGTAGTAAMRSQTLDTPDGPFTIVESADGDVVASGWSADIRAVSARAGIPPESVIAGESHSAPAVRSFYEGDATGIAAVPVRSKGTDFQEKVWEYLRSIPAGEVRTYSEVAAALGRPRAFRAVAQACGRNPAGLFVPCHRVVAAGGALAGFAWGINVKKKLLAREAALIR